MAHALFMRIFIDLLIASSVFNGWWFFVLPLVIFGSWKYPFFIEFIIAGIVYDVLFGFVPELGIKGYLGTLTSIFIFTMIFLFKKVARK